MPTGNIINTRAAQRVRAGNARGARRPWTPRNGKVAIKNIMNEKVNAFKVNII